jgi:hypothetical protein
MKNFIVGFIAQDCTHALHRKFIEIIFLMKTFDLFLDMPALSALLIIEFKSYFLFYTIKND